MKTGLWLVLVVVAGFLGFLIGYSMPPTPPLAGATAAKQPTVQQDKDAEKRR